MTSQAAKDVEDARREMDEATDHESWLRAFEKERDAVSRLTRFEYKRYVPF